MSENETPVMVCTTCKAIVMVNATGVCLGCQMGRPQSTQEDSYAVEKERRRVKLLDEHAELTRKIQEKEDALQEREAKKMDVRLQADASKGVVGRRKSGSATKSKPQKKDGKSTPKKKEK